MSYTYYKGAKKNSGEYYAEYDKDTELWCVFDSESSKAHASYADKASAEKDAKKRNGMGKKANSTLNVRALRDYSRSLAAVQTECLQKSISLYNRMHAIFMPILAVADEVGEDPEVDLSVKLEYKEALQAISALSETAQQLNLISTKLSSLQGKLKDQSDSAKEYLYYYS